MNRYLKIAAIVLPAGLLVGALVGHVTERLAVECAQAEQMRGM